MSNSWLEPEWKIPRSGDIVKSPDNVLGKVVKIEGTMLKRQLWINDVNGLEIYSGEDAEDFMKVSLDDAKMFEIERHGILGYKVGTICKYKNNSSIPLEIIKMDWNMVRHKMIYHVKDLRVFKEEIFRSDNSSDIIPFKEEYPSLENIYSDSLSGLKYRINISIEKTNNTGWTNCGSPLEFNYEEDAIREIESFNSRLKIRRIASVLNADWNLSFPCYTIDAFKDNKGNIQSRIIQVKNFINHPGYFKTGCHAAYALKLIPLSDWLNACTVSFDRAI